MKKRIFAVLLCLAAAVLTAAGVVKYRADCALTELAVYSDMDYELHIYERGEPDFPFGAAHSRLELKSGRARIVRLDIDIQNDGKHPDSGNFSVSWQEDGVIVTVSGEEQPDRIYTLFYNGASADWNS